jgi:hypothetical protein
VVVVVEYLMVGIAMYFGAYVHKSCGNEGYPGSFLFFDNG